MHASLGVPSSQLRPATSRIIVSMLPPPLSAPTPIAAMPALFLPTPAVCPPALFVPTPATNALATVGTSARTLCRTSNPDDSCDTPVAAMPANPIYVSPDWPSPCLEPNFEVTKKVAALLRTDEERATMQPAELNDNTNTTFISFAQLTKLQRQHPGAVNKMIDRNIYVLRIRNLQRNTQRLKKNKKAVTQQLGAAKRQVSQADAVLKRARNARSKRTNYARHKKYVRRLQVWL